MTCSTETIDVDGVPMTIVDTAGVRSQAGDAVEAEGIARAVAARETAAAIVLVLDRSAPLTADDRDLLATTESAQRIVVANKADLPPAWDVADVARWSPGGFSEDGRRPRGAAKSAARSDDVRRAGA